MNVMNVVKLIPRSQALEYIRELRREKPCKGTKCEKTFSHKEVLENIRELTQVRSIMNLMNVVKIEKSSLGYIREITKG